MGTNGLTRALWNGPGGKISLWTINADGSVPSKEYGPFSGWACTSIATGPDGLTRLLWTSAGGNASVWTVQGDGTPAFHQYGPVAGLSAVGVAVGPDNKERLLWDGPNGSAQVWTINADGSYTAMTYPLAPTLTAAATGPNKVTLYWTGTTGASGYNVYRGTVSGGPYALVASNITTGDPGPGMTGSFLYSDVAGLTSGTEYFYVVRAVQGGGETVQSDKASDTPQANAVPWDTGSPAQIVAQVSLIVASNLASDEPAVGELTIGGPNGVIYQSFQDGSSAQAYATPGHYDSGGHTLVYADGNEVPAPIDTADSNPGIPAAPAPASCPQFKQSLGMTYSTTKPPSGIFREVQTQPGYAGFLSW